MPSLSNNWRGWLSSSKSSSKSSHGFFWNLYWANLYFHTNKLRVQITRNTVTVRLNSSKKPSIQHFGRVLNFPYDWLNSRAYGKLSAQTSPNDRLTAASRHMILIILYYVIRVCNVMIDVLTLAGLDLLLRQLEFCGVITDLTDYHTLSCSDIPVHKLTRLQSEVKWRHRLENVTKYRLTIAGVRKLTKRNHRARLRPKILPFPYAT